MLDDLGVWVPVLTIGATYAIFAIGLQIQVGHAGLDNFGQVAFFLMGAYASAIAYEQGLGVSASAAMGVAAATCAALVIALPAVRLRGDFLAITAIAAGEILRAVANNTAFLGGPKGKSGGYFNRDIVRPLRRELRDAGIEVDRGLPLLVLTVVVALVLAMAVSALLRTPWGRVLRAVRENDAAAQALGKNAFLLKLQGMALGGALAGVAGVLFSYAQVQFSPKAFEPIVTFTGFVIIIIAGIGSIWGAALVGVLIQGLLEGTRYIDIPGLGSDREAALRFIVVGVVLMCSVAFRPQGIFGSRREMVIR